MPTATADDVFQAALGLKTDVPDMEGMHVFPKKETAVLIKAPIVIDATTKEGVQPLLDLAHNIETHSNTEVAEEESRRLSSYFSAMSVYLAGVIEKSVVEEKEPLKKLATPGALSGIFNAMAACTRNTLTSEVLILPDNIKDKSPARHLFQGDEFNRDYKHGEYSFNFGFLQIHEINNTCSTTLPVFLIDSKMMARVAPHQPLPMLQAFQDVMTIVNHDMLHHFTSPLVGSRTMFKFNSDLSQPLEDWDKHIPHAENGEVYEDWAHIGHEKILMTAAREKTEKDVRDSIDRYFDELKRVREELNNRIYVSENPIINFVGLKIANTFENTLGRFLPLDLPAKEIHTTIDFFGMMMAHTLERLFPLNHPLMLHCLKRLEETDPNPGESLADLCETIKDSRTHKTLSPKEALMHLRGPHSLNNPTIMENYRKQGLEIIPKEGTEIPYMNIKLLQLIRISRKDIINHTPAELNTKMGTLRSATDQLTLDMLKAAAKTTKYTPL